MITHWDEVEGTRRERGHIAASWQSLSGANSITAGVAAHLGRAGSLGDAAPPRGLGGGDLLRPLRDGRLATRVRATKSGRSRSARATASCIARSSTRTRSAPATTGSSCSRSGSGTTRRTRSCRAPASPGSARPGCSQGAPEDHPWAREAAVGAPTLGRARRATRRRSSTSPTCPRTSASTAASSTSSRDLGDAAGSERTGLSHYVIAPGKLMNPPHVHSAEEEIFVVLDGERHAAAVPEPARSAARSRSFPCGRAARSPGRPARGARTRSGRATTGMTLLALRHARPERHRLLPALGEDQLPRRRGDRAARAARLLGRRG